MMNLKIIRFFLLGLLVVLICGACTTLETKMKSWVGKSEADLLMHWGAPDLQITTQAGEKVYTWEHAWRAWVRNGSCRKSFVIGEDGLVKKSFYNGCGPRDDALAAT